MLVIAAAAPGAQPARAQDEPARWLGLGDSYSAGEGLPGIPDEAPFGKACQRARGSDDPVAWAPQAAAAVQPPLRLDFVACTGAITDDLLRATKRPSIQVDEALATRGTGEIGSYRWPVVSFSFGGNNLGFREMLMTCVGASVEGGLTALAGGGANGLGGAVVGWLGAPWVGCDVSEQEVLARVDRLTDVRTLEPNSNLDCARAHSFGVDSDDLVDGALTLPELYQLIGECVVSPHGVVIVMGYPQLVEEPSRWDGGVLEGNRCQRIRRADVGRLRSAGARLNDEMHKDVVAVAARYPDQTWIFVDPNNFWEGDHYGPGSVAPDERDRDSHRHALCGKGLDWLNGVSFTADRAAFDWFNRSFHPNQYGQDAMARAVGDQAGQVVQTVASLGSGAAGSMVSATSLVFDTSGSMDEPADSGARKIDAAIRAGQDLLQLVRADSATGGTHRAGAVQFSDAAAEVSPLGSDVDAMSMQIAQLAPQDQTNLGDGLTRGLDQLSSAPGDRSLVLLSDGITNAGVSRDEILAELVPRANQEGVRIFTIGFGQPGQIDEDLLRRLASGTGGAYGFADSALGLRRAFLHARLSATGSVVADLDGSVSQGEVLEAGSFAIDERPAQLEVSLVWPGSDLDMRLIDPDGKVVDRSYAGATLFQDTNPEVLVVGEPKRGEWRIDVEGKDVPAGAEEFAALASVRGQAPEPAGGRSLLFPILAGLGFVGVAGTGGALGTRARRRRAKGAWRCANCDARGQTGRFCENCGVPRVATLTLTVVGGPSQGAAFRVAPGEVLGRGAGVDHVVADDSVSRRHLQFVLLDDGWGAVDLESTAGTLRNGEPIVRAHVRSGDVITIGQTSLRVE